MRKIGYILAFDIILVAICAIGIYRLALKPQFPATISESIITDILPESPLHIGDSIISVVSRQIENDDEVEFLCNQYSEQVPIEIKRNGESIHASVKLVKEYPLQKLLIESFAALIFFLTGIAVLLLQRKEKSARIFHHLCVGIASLILLSPGIFTSLPSWLDRLFGVLFYFSYTLVPVLFVHFTVVFPRQKFSAVKSGLLPVYSIGVVISIWASVMLLRAASTPYSLEYFESYNRSNSAVLLFFAVAFFIGFANIIQSYRTEKEEFERRKLKWILFGIIAGACAYIFFSNISRLLIHRLVFPEEYLIGFSVIAPISFAIAIIRFRVFDIDLIVKRSAVYTSVIALLLAAYLGIVWIFSQFFISQVPSAIPNIIGTLSIALLFEPLRRWVQKFIDKKFFRVSYNFHEAQRSFLEEIKFVSTKISLANFVTERMHTLLPVTKAGFFVVESPSDKLRLLAHHNFDLLERRNIQLSTGDLKTGLENPVALDEKIEPGIEYESADSKVFRRWGIALVLPMLSSNRNILGFLVLGEKLSGTRFSVEDISLLTSVSTQSALALERLKVEYALMLEQAESERLNELNKLKSYFVSSVSHDLKTPLTSIKLFAEFLKEHENLPRQKAMEYFGIIEGEADRLSRLITNVLDFAKIEKGTKEYHLKRHDLNEIVSNVMNSLDYQISSNGHPLTKSAGGAGLGLSLVKHTMEAHGGKIEVQKRAGKR